MAMSIRLSFTNATENPNSHRPCFLSDGGIEGRITIHNQLGRDFDLVKISLEGVLLNSFRYGVWPSAQREDVRKLQILLRMSDIKKRSDFTNIIRNGQQLARCSFHFYIPQCLGRNLLGEDAEHLSDLPPSMSCCEVTPNNAQPSKTCMGESTVYYTVRADVIRGETTIGLTARPVHIIPTLRSRPPICLSDFGNEYTVTSTKSLRGTGMVNIQKIGTGTVEAAEPETIVLNQSNSSLAVTVPLNITLKPTNLTSSSSYRAKRDQVQFEQQVDSILNNKVTCNASLISSTYISMLPRRGVPTQSEADKSNKLRHVTSVCSRTTAATTPVTATKSTSTSGTLSYRTTATINFTNFKDNVSPLPSFDSSMLSHRYRIALRIQLASSMSFLLEIPVTIRYSSSSPSDEPPSFEQSTTPITPPSDLDVEEVPLTSRQMQDLLQAQTALLTSSSSLLYGSLDLLPSHHPSRLGIEAPPYVV